jgi:hypothetical protein
MCTIEWPLVGGREQVGFAGKDSAVKVFRIGRVTLPIATFLPRKTTRVGAHVDQAAADTEITIRDFTIDDYPAVQSLWTEAGLPFRPFGRDRADRVAAQIARDTAVFLVADAGGRLAGTWLRHSGGIEKWFTIHNPSL